MKALSHPSSLPALGLNAAGRRLPHAGILLSYLPIYVFLDWISYVYPVSPLNITPWNPPSGLSLFLLLHAGMRWWPLVILAPILSDLVLRDAPAPFPELVASAVLIGGTYAIAARLLAGRIRSAADLGALPVFAFFVGVVVAATLCAALSFVGFYTLLGEVPGTAFPANCVRYWIGDLNGVLALTPMLLWYAELRLGRGSPRLPDLAEGLLQFAAIVLSLWLVFAIEAGYRFEFFELVFLPLIWVAVRRGLGGATWAIAVIQLGLIVAVKNDSAGMIDFVQLQASMIALCLTGLVLGALVSHRAQIVASLAEKEAALGRAMQFAAVGEMSSALVHEVSQPVGALLRYLGVCQMIASNTDGDSPLLRETLGKALGQANRASEVLHRVSAFFRRGAVQRAAVDPVALVFGAVDSARRGAEQQRVQILVSIGPALVPAVHIDRLQIEMVLQNLLNNAIEALAAQGRGGQVEVRIRSGTDCLEVTVDDSGPGLPAELLPRLFEPFVTTKPNGMGLGLAISRSFAQANDGDLLLQKGVLGGAYFVLRLPLHRENA